jgi:hypothetical protein
VQADLFEIRRLQGQTGDKDPEAEEFECVAVQSLIQRHLMLQEAGRRSVHANSLDEARLEIERRLLPLKQQQAIQEWLAEQEEQAEIEVF